MKVKCLSKPINHKAAVGTNAEIRAFKGHMNILANGKIVFVMVSTLEIDKLGQGTCFYMNGDLYIGEWKSGQRHGFGQQFYKRGERYKGNWMYDKKEGNGVLVSNNGTRFIG